MNAVDSYLIALSFVPDWFVTNNIIEKLENNIFSNDHVTFGDIGSDIITFFSNDDWKPKTINHVRLMASYNRYKEYKTCKKRIDEKLVPVAWYPIRT